MNFAPTSADVRVDALAMFLRVADVPAMALRVVGDRVMALQVADAAPVVRVGIAPARTSSLIA